MERRLNRRTTAKQQREDTMFETLWTMNDNRSRNMLERAEQVMRYFGLMRNMASRAIAAANFGGWLF